MIGIIESRFKEDDSGVEEVAISGKLSCRVRARFFSKIGFLGRER